MFKSKKTGTSGGYQISRSLRFRSSASAYLSRSVASTTNRKTWTWSGWVKRGTLGTDQELMMTYYPTSNCHTNIQFNTSDQLAIYDYDAGGGTFVWVLYTSALFRDTSAWYHLVIAVDTTQATSSNRVKIYINGVLQTSLAVATYPSLNYDNQFNVAGTTAYQGTYMASTYYHDGYRAEQYFIDGQALDASYFGQTDSTTGVWGPKSYSGTYGTNGFHLNFSDNSAATAAAIGKDSSGNGNNWTPTNISVTAGATNDSLIDTPTPYGIDTGVGGEVRGNYGTWNPLDISTATNGNLTTTNGGNGNSYSNFGMSSGKWYCEVTLTAMGGLAASTIVGVIATLSNKTANAAQNMSPAVGYVSDGNKVVDTAATSYGTSYTTNDVIGIAIDIDGGSVTFYKNGASQGAISKTLAGQGTGAWIIYTVAAASGASNTWVLNTGQRPFAYAAPSGYKAMCATNIAAPTIIKSNQYFDTTLYTGNGTSQSVTGLNFAPDLVWTKNRSSTYTHCLFDTTRGATKYLQTSNLNAEGTSATTITSFNSDGYSMGGDPGTNGNALTYVGWSWKKGATPGFDIVTYTGNGANRTIAHSLGAVPTMMIVKSRSAGSTHWTVYHQALGTGKGALLDDPTVYTSSQYWNSTAPTSSVFSLGTDGGVNTNSATYVNYLFTDIAGFSKFGSYTGNGSANGPFVHCGFRPAFIMIKHTGGDNWTIVDTKRDTYNVAATRLFPNLTNAEVNSTNNVDMLSNGFKVRIAGATDAGANAINDTYLYAAFAENPFKYSLAR